MDSKRIEDALQILVSKGYCENKSPIPGYKYHLIEVGNNFTRARSHDIWMHLVCTNSLWVPVWIHNKRTRNYEWDWVTFKDVTEEQFALFCEYFDIVNDLAEMEKAVYINEEDDFIV